ncbi:MAG TPA: DNA mismatch repair endonuclease MutL [Polyangiaceae bacterium]|nr:DNA mismatch repair endonuclease MutL [Polyangiaceae bacterium]
MPEIRVLSDEIASQIAAGEVVERPASALKELLENALDSGATRCGVEIEGGGLTRIAVLDDGCGMSEEDARLSLKRHATSKLRAFADLEQLTSYGFRGEALPSIASVSRLLLRTRRADSSSGVELSLEGGLEPEVRPAGCAPGTLVEVRDLFFNVPARRKFLRSAGTESGHLADVVEAVALSRPDLAVTLKRDGRMLRQWLRVSDRRQRVLTAFEEELAECQGERGPLRVEAYLTRPERARTGAGGLHLFVNNRPIRDRALAVAAAQAYGSVLERGRYPRGVIYLDLPPRLVDFNVHPQKIELRFAEPRAVSDALYQVLSSKLARGFSAPAPLGAPAPGRAAPPVLRDVTAERAAPEPPPLQQQGVLEPPRAAPPAAASSVPPAPDLRSWLESPRAAWARAQQGHTLDARPPGAPRPPAPPTPPAQEGPSTADDEPSSEPALTERSLRGPAQLGEHVEWANLTFLAQLKQTFLICEGPAGLYVLDQHAAAERVTFDRLRRQYRERTVASQALLFPVEVELGADETEFLEQHAAEFGALGMDLRLRGTQWVSVHGVPRLLERLSPERLLRDLLAETMRQGGRGFSGAVDLALATLACHASLRAGDPIAPAEATALLAALDGTDFAGHCPHGRPIVSFTSYAELERKVGRR